MFDPKLTVGQVLSEDEVNSTFGCQPFKGIRMGMNNKVIVIMSGSAKKKIYEDVWQGDTLLYNGMDVSSDVNGNQTMETAGANNNLKLFNTWKDPDSADVFLFVKRETNKCVYKGRVHIKQEPYLAPRHDDPSRKVWIFPLQLESVDQEKNSEVFQEVETAAYDIELDDLYKKVKGKADKKQPKEVTKKYDSTTSYYERDPEISTYVKRRAGGLCDLCDEPAPFKDKDGHPYLEAHHIIWLSKGGADEIENVVALCPNCHRRMHVVADANDVNTLQQKVKYYQKKGM